MRSVLYDHATRMHGTHGVIEALGDFTCVSLALLLTSALTCSQLVKRMI